MKNLNSNYTKQLLKNTNSSKGDYITLAEAVKNKSYSRKTLLKGLKSLIRHEDYNESDKMDLIDHLYKLSNPTEEVEKDVKFTRKQSQISK